MERLIAKRVIRLPKLTSEYQTRTSRNQIATKAPRHQAKHLINIHLCALASWWRKCFAIRCAEFTIKTLKVYQLAHPKPKRDLYFFSIIVLMVAIAFMFASCRTFVEKPTKDTAMEKISSYSYPQFSDDLDYHGLEHGILQSLVYLRKIPVDRVFVFGSDHGCSG